MKAMNVGGDVTKPIVAFLEANPGQRFTGATIARLTRLEMRRCMRGVSELVAKGVLQSGESGVRHRGKKLRGFWMAGDKAAAGALAPAPQFAMRPLNTSILRPRSIREGAGLGAVPGVVIHQSVYDRSRP